MRNTSVRRLTPPAHCTAWKGALPGRDNISQQTALSDTGLQPRAKGDETPDQKAQRESQKKKHNGWVSETSICSRFINWVIKSTSPTNKGRSSTEKAQFKCDRIFRFVQESNSLKNSEVLSLRVSINTEVRHRRA